MRNTNDEATSKIEPESKPSKYRCTHYGYSRLGNHHGARKGRDSAKDPSGACFKIGLIFVKIGPRKFRIIALSRRVNKMKRTLCKRAVPETQIDSLMTGFYTPKNFSTTLISVVFL